MRRGWRPWTFVRLETDDGLVGWGECSDNRSLELALWDLKAKALGVPVYELFGGPLRDRVRLYWSHSLHLCAVLPNVRIMEIDIDDVPWKGSLVTRPPVIHDRHIRLSETPGWGADIDEQLLREHPWPRPGDGGAPLFYGMDPGQMTTRPR